MDKAEIRKILSELSFQCHTCGSAEYDCPTTEEEKCDKFLFATSSLTALIIKWLEERKVNIEDHHQKYYPECHRCIEILARNQLITELVEEMK